MYLAPFLTAMLFSVQLPDREIIIRLAAGTRFISSPKVWTASGAHSVCYLMGAVGKAADFQI
jgi:hypothetical protein